MKRLFALALFFVPIVLQAQPKEIRLQYSMLDIPSSNFYIERVIDERPNQKSIGAINSGKQTDSIDLKGGTTQAMGNYLHFLFPKDNNKSAIVMKITKLSIVENKTSTSDTVVSKFAVSFYLSNNGNLTEVFNTGVNYSNANKDGLDGLESSLKQCLSKCLSNFINSNTLANQNQNVQTNVNPSNSIPDTNSATSENLNTEALTKNYILSCTSAQGINASGVSISFYSYYNKDRNGWIIPWVLSIDIMNLKSDYFKQFNYQSAKLNYYMPGICAFKKINDYIWFNLGVQIPIGTEALTDFHGNKTTNAIFGVAPMQGLYVIPQGTGLMFGIGVYERILTSKVYKSDLGLKAEIGFKF